MTTNTWKTKLIGAVLALPLALAAAPMVQASSQEKTAANPCAAQNPCTPKKAANPCAGQNPCAAKPK